MMVLRSGGSSRFFFDDRMGTATKETDSLQAVTKARAYDAFGNFVASSGSSPSPFGYAGGYGYQEDATGLKLLGHRYYDPETGRFLTRDPIRDGRNWYIYCDNNPLRWVDPLGLDRIWIGIKRGQGSSGSTGAHAMIGFEQDNGSIVWYGLYPDGIHVETGVPDEKYFIDVDRKSVHAAKRAVYEDMRRERNDWTASYNCSTWVYDVLFRAGLVPDIRGGDSQYSKGILTTPKKLPTMIPDLEGPYEGRTSRVN